MINKVNIEKFYDYFDEVADILYHGSKVPYIEGINEAFNYLLDGTFEGEYTEENIEKISNLKTQIVDIDFEREEIRKAVQLGMLKGYKHTFSSNELITPDTIGLFIGYLIKKFYNEKPINAVLDPLIGSGNLVYTVLNYLDKSSKVYGIDNDIIKCNLARNLGDLLDIENEMFFQDTLSYYDQGFDVVLTDMPVSEETPYLPYQVINHHLDGLKAGGYYFSIIENDFFEKQGNDVFKKEIDNKGYIIGLIKLSETLFKSNPKSILIIRKKGEGVQPHKDFLLVDLPSFNDVQAFNKTLQQIDLWISIRKDDFA